MFNKLPEGYTPVLTDTEKNVWILRDPEDQKHCIQVLPYSVSTIEIIGPHPYKAAKWSDVRG